MLTTALLLALGSGCAPVVAPAAPDDTAPVEEVPSACDLLEHPDVVVNEILPSNLAGCVDADGETSDWIEIRVLDTAAVDLAGWSLSEGDDRWTFPSRTVEPGGILLVFASGADRDGEELHADFALDALDPRVTLAAPDGCTVDALAPGRMYGDVSYGRTDADPDVLGFFLEPTPGAPNTTEARPGFAATPTLSPEAGFHDGPVEVVAASPEAGATLRVTFDGSEPVESSEVVVGPIAIDAIEAPVVVRARAWVDGLWPGRVATATYSRDPAILADDLAVVSLVVDPDDLWNEKTGIYVYGPPDYVTTYPYFGANFWEDWERPVHVEVWEPDGTLVLAQDAGISIHGGYTRAFEQKSFRLDARSAYGPERMEYRFFPQEDVDSWENIVLEGAGDWCPTHTENAFPDLIFRDPNGVRYPTVETQAWEPCVVYLNGVFWGLYAFREKQDERYVEARYGADPDNLDRIECTADEDGDWWHLNQGTWDAFDELNAWVAGADLSDPAAWDAFQERADVENLATTVLVMAYAEASDWWYNNLRLWREREEGAPFRWMPFDFGHGWNSYSYDHIGVSVAWSGPGLPIADALENEAFTALLANQAAEFLATSLRPESALPRLDEMHARIEPVIPAQYALWCGQDPSTWQASVDYARTFVQQRPAYLRHQVGQNLGLGTATLSLASDPAGSGTFRFSIVEVEAPFSGAFYTGVPITVTAVPADGWSFAGWSDADLGGDAAATFVLDADRAITAAFE